ncbi:MAG: alpha/beta hydrolase [Patescibacteria group bacterium]
MDQSKLLFGVEKEKVRLYVVANSIGGTVTVTLKDKFKYIDRLVLAGSGTGGQGSTKPILSTCPPEKEVLDSTSRYKGDLLFLQGSLDDIVPFEAQDKLYNSFKKSKKEKIIIEGANHNFTKINGENKRLAQNLYIDFILKFLTR